jgi:hypothetical protein
VVWCKVKDILRVWATPVATSPAGPNRTRQPGLLLHSVHQPLHVHQRARTPDTVWRCGSRAVGWRRWRTGRRRPSKTLLTDFSLHFVTLNRRTTTDATCASVAAVVVPDFRDMCVRPARWHLTEGQPDKRSISQQRPTLARPL